MINIAKQYLHIGLVGKLELIKYYNLNCLKLVKPSRRYEMGLGDNWCALFTSVVAHKAGLSPQKFPYEVSVREQVVIAKDYGMFFNVGLASVGDLIVYDWRVNGNFNHVGIITEIKIDKLTVLEGNYKGTVDFRTISTDSKYIGGIIKL